MYRSLIQRGMLTIFYSCGFKPLDMWDVVTQDGYVAKFLDPELKSMVFEIRGNNVSTTYMICPSKNRVLAISMPFLVMIVKNLKKYFTFEITVLDDNNIRRRFRVSNFQSSTSIQSMCTVMPIGLADGWNQIQFNLAEFTRRAYNRQFVEVLKVQINANIRIRRIYFAEKLVLEEELPAEYKLYFPLVKKPGKQKKGEKAGAPAVEGKKDSKLALATVGAATQEPEAAAEAPRAEVAPTPAPPPESEPAPVVPKEEPETPVTEAEAAGDTTGDATPAAEADATVEGSAAATAKASAAGMAEPTAEVTADPMAEPTTEPTAEPTEAATPVEAPAEGAPAEEPPVETTTPAE